jgi:hypothetical protein
MVDLQTISPEYLRLQKELHKNPHYGTASLGFADAVKQLIQKFDVKSLSDYGAGKCNLRKGFHDLGVTNFEYFPYDPAFPEYGQAHAADLVCCIDVLEHIEPDYLPSVLLDLSAITRKRGFFSVYCKPADKVLSDGRNAHLIQKPSSWWLPKLCEYFEISQLRSDDVGFWVLVEPRVVSGQPQPGS